MELFLPPITIILSTDLDKFIASICLFFVTSQIVLSITMLILSSKYFFNSFVNTSNLVSEKVVWDTTYTLFNDDLWISLHTLGMSSKSSIISQLFSI